MKHGPLMLIVLATCWLAVLPMGAHAEPAAKGGAKMHTYMVLFGFTSEGIRNIKESPDRVAAAKEVVERMGGQMKAFYGILGSQFDTIFILDAPDDESVAKMVLTIASGGNVRTETHRLFTEEEYRKVISELP
jgi:uncharacterized protein with GYD domain